METFQKKHLKIIACFLIVIVLANFIIPSLYVFATTGSLIIPTKKEYLYEGKTLKDKITATLNSTGGNVYWYSDNSSVVKVISGGNNSKNLPYVNIEILKTGNANLIAKDKNNNKLATCKIIVSSNNKTNTQKESSSNIFSFDIVSIIFELFFNILKGVFSIFSSTSSIEEQPVSQNEIVTLIPPFSDSCIYKGVSTGHTAIDYSYGITLGTSVKAAASGTVVTAVSNYKDNSFNKYKFASGTFATYGNYVKIKHADGTCTLYAHLYKVNVSVNDKVKQGDIIGTVGSTGNSTGYHLHFEYYDKFGNRKTPPFVKSI